jgi:hypothetical protein
MTDVTDSEKLYLYTNQEMSNSIEYVYIMSNESFTDDTFKIGWTRDNPKIRANTLQTSGVPTPFIIEYIINTSDGSTLEKLIHKHLKTYRIKDNREFFKISKDTLKEILTTELNLELKQIDDVPISKKVISENKEVNEINKVFLELLKDSKEFFSNFKKENTRLCIKEIDKKLHLSVIKSELDSSSTCLDFCFDNDEEYNFKNNCFSMNRSIESYGETVFDLLNNYESIKERIGYKRMNQDNKFFKKQIIDTHMKLKKIQTKYIFNFNELYEEKEIL